METEVINNTQVNETENVNELEAIKAECETLKAENAELLKKYESEKKMCLRYYRMMGMLKKGLDSLIESEKITMDDVTKAVIQGQGVDNIDDLLYALSD